MTNTNLTVKEINTINKRISMTHSQVLFKDVFKKEMPMNMTYETALKSVFEELGPTVVAEKLVVLRGNKDEMLEYKPKPITNEMKIITMLVNEKSDDEIRKELAERNASSEWVEESLIKFRKKMAGFIKANK